MRKLMALLLSMALVFGAVGCVSEELPTEVSNEEPAATTETETEEATEPEPEMTEAEQEEMISDMVLADELKINFTLGNNKRTITYNQAEPLELTDGTVVTQGDLKPVWQYIEDQLGFDVTDVAVQDQKSSEMIDIAAALSFTDATVYGGSGIAEKLMSYGAQGYFLNLLDYTDYMPNFKAYLEENPNVASSVTAYDGNIYFAPYAAEIGNYARIFNLRETWVTTVLDSGALESETETLDTVYEGYWDRNATNVVDLQNEAAGGTLTRDVALDTLLAYISETYPEYTNPSDLYLGADAQYDMDELVALWRVIKLSPNTLTKVTTGDVVDGAIIAPFFIRKSKYREDTLRLVNYFGGQRVFGSDSYGAKFYLDADGVLQFSQAEDGFLAGIDQLSNIYAEGLIHAEFAEESNTDDFRKELVAKDTEEGHLEFGFMTGDWIQSTTASNPDIVGVLPPMTTVNGSDFMHWVENSRVVKPDGWAISVASSEEEINAALTLFDYFYSEEGNVVQNYSLPSALETGSVYTAPDGTEYPQFNQWLYDIVAEMKDGDVSGFLRDFLGAQIPIGYQKEIGFELQNTVNHGGEAWDLYIGNGVLMNTYDSEDPYFRLVPPVFSLTEQDTAKIATLAVGDDQVDQLFLYISNSPGALGSVEELSQMYIDAGIEQYVEVYRGAYARMTGE